MRKATYGERMQEFERQQDESFWNRRFQNALKKQDYTEIEELLKEAFDEEYDLPLTSDPRVLQIIERLKQA